MADLKTNYKDDVLDTSVNEKRKFNMIQNSDGTVSFEDVTEYSQVGDSFGAADINATNAAVNEVNSNLYSLDYDNKIDLSSVITSADSSFTPQKKGVITCKMQAIAQNGCIAFNQHGITLMFLNQINTYARSGGMCIVDDSQISISIYLNIKIEELYFIPFK